MCWKSHSSRPFEVCDGVLSHSHASKDKAHTLKGTLTCRSHNITWYEIYVLGRRNLVVYVKMLSNICCVGSAQLSKWNSTYKMQCAKLTKCSVRSKHIQISPTSYVGLIWRSAAVATASWTIHEGALKVSCSCFERSYHACSNCGIPWKVLPTCCSHSDTTLNETYIASQEESGCVYICIWTL